MENEHRLGEELHAFDEALFDELQIRGFVRRWHVARFVVLDGGPLDLERVAKLLQVQLSYGRPWKT